MKKRILQLTLSIFFLVQVAVFAQPANDNCSGATSLGTLATPAACPSGVGANTNFSGTLVAATPGNPYITQPNCSGAGGPTMSTFANDVWYTFTASSYHCNITINSTFANPNIAFYSGTCGALGGGIGGCAVGAGGTVNLTVDQMTPGTTYVLQISGNGAQTGTFTGTISNDNDCGGCMQSSTLTPNPLPVNGAYTPGQVVQFCYHISSYLQANTNWQHGVQVSFGTGWVGTPANLNASNTTSPASWSGDGGNWAYYPTGINATLGNGSSVPFPAGFYYDTGGDGNPGNNYGDVTTPNNITTINPVPAGEWTYCFTLTVDPGCSPGSDLSVTINTSGDGESGGWNNNGCNSDAPLVAPAIGACCQPNMSSAPVTCVGSDGTATATPVGAAGPYDYSWTGPSPYTHTSTNIAGADNITGLAAGTYTVAVTDANNCQVSNTVVVTAGGATPPAPTTAPISYCLNAAAVALTATPSAGGTLNWYGTAATGGTSSATAPTPSTATAGPTIYYVSQTIGGCEGPRAPLTVTINTLPVATATANTPCVGQALTLTGGPAAMTTYTWTGVNTGGTQNLNIASASAANAGVSTLTVTDGNGCQGSANVTVTINTLPVATATANTPCVGQALTLTGGPVAMTTYAWTGVNTGATQNLNIASASAANAGVSTLTVTDGNGCTGSVNVTVTVNALPIATATANTPCVGQALTLTGGPAAMTTYAWTGVNTGATQNLNIASAAAANAGVSTLTVTDGNGCNGSANVTVTINALPIATATANTPCIGQALTLTGGPAAMTTYTWTGVNTGATQNLNIASAAAANAGVSTLTVTDGNGCTGSANVTVTINTLPIATATASTPCAGQALTLTGGPAGMTTYAWTGVNTGATQNLNIASASAANNGVSTLTVTDANGCTGSANVTVAVNALPIANAGADGSVCAGSGATLSGSGAGAGGSYSWIWAAGNAATSNITQSPTIDTWYELTVTDANGCADKDSAKIMVNPLPLVDFTVPAVCTGDSSMFVNTTIDPSGGGPLTTFWSFGDGLTANTYTSHHEYLTCGTFSTTLIATTDSGCQDVKTHPVIVNCVPTAAFTASNVCFPSATNFNNTSSITGAIPLSYDWDFNYVAATHTTDDVTQSPSHNFTDGTYVIDLIVSTTAGCSDTVSHTIVSYPKPLADFSLTSVCLNDLTNFTDLTTINAPDNITNWCWDFDNNGTCDMNGGTGITHQFNGLPPITATLIVTSNNGCMDTISHAVTIYPLPVAAFTVAAVCEGTASQFVNNSTVSAGSSINVNNWIFDTAVGGPTSIAVAPTYTYPTSGSYVVQLKVTTNFGCVDSVQQNAIVNPNPVVNFTADTTSGCQPLCINLSDLSTISSVPPGSVNSTYSWSFGDGNSGSTSTQSHCYNNAGSYNVGLTVTSNNGCITTLVKPAYITVYPNPIAEFSTSPSSTTILDPHFSLTDLSQGAAIINWNFGDHDTLTTYSSSTLDGVEHTYADTGCYVITQTVISQFGCVDSIKHEVCVGPEFTFYIPNVFTPNGDKKNDLFNGKGIGIIKYELLIFNRWGELIYRLNTLEGGWDGTTFTSGTDICQTDVYVWKVNLTDVFNQPHNYIGSVTLLK